MQCLENGGDVLCVACDNAAFLVAGGVALAQGISLGEDEIF